ncbi:Cell division protein FtsH [Chitinispirillum alkaliphilum]|nr:Cell division protein FtsH [Chitinispirillum alkaliphilum]
MHQHGVDIPALQQKSLIINPGGFGAILAWYAGDNIAHMIQGGVSMAYNSQKKPPQQPGKQKVSRSPNTIIWILILVTLGYLAFSRYVAENRVSLSYSTFKEQVREGNVASVTIEENHLRGEFSTPYEKVLREGADTTTYTYFETVNPGYENAELVSLMEDHDVTVDAVAAQNNWWWILLLIMLPWFLIMLYGMYVRSKLMKGGGGGNAGPGGGLFNIGKSRARKYQKTPHTNVAFDDVAGLRNAKKELEEIVGYLKNPQKFISLGAEIPKGVLLMGPPGTGKTLLARAVAGEAGVPFFSISGSEFIEMFVGVGASRVRHMFQEAKQRKPAIVFIDELDAIGRSRGAGMGGGHDEREQTLNQILSEMDGFEPQESVVVIAATNRPDILDPALVRPGRFDRRVLLDLPERDARVHILSIHTRKVPLEDSVDLGKIAARTVGFSGADLKNLVNESALLAGRKGKDTVSMEDFDEGADKIMLGLKQDRGVSDREKKIIAYHETGHALVAKFMPEADPLQKMTIVSRGRAMGATQQIPELDRHHLSRQYLLTRIAVSLGGRTSERLIFGDVTNGAAQDLKQATDIARKMVCNWGMSERLGSAVFSAGQDGVFLGKEISQQKDYSDKTGKIIDEEIQKIIGDMEQQALDILEKNRESLDRIVAELLERETLEDKDIDKLLEKHKK